MSLEGFTDHELQEELRRRKAARKPMSAFKCHNCGVEGFYVGHFKPCWFEIQKSTFDHKHRDCKPCCDGGGI